MPAPDNISASSMLALCPCSGGLAGLALDAGAPLDAARPFHMAAKPGDPAATAAHPGPLPEFARTPAILMIDDSGAPLLTRLKGRTAALPVRDLLPSPLSAPGTPSAGKAAAPDTPVLRLFTIERMTKKTSTDRSHAFITGMLSLPGVTERSQRHGLSLLWLDPDRVYAALVFRDALYAMAGLSFPALFAPEGDGGYATGAAALVRLLDDFRLGWLPTEEAARRGGEVWRADTLPPEAEGFRPFFAAGPEAGKLTGLARVMQDAPERILCRGILHGCLLAEERIPSQTAYKA